MEKSFKQLKVWHKSVDLVKEIYNITKELPKDEQYNLINQMRRSAISIPANIAEGYKRKGLGEYIQFLSIADASAAELETLIVICKEVYSNINYSKADALLEEVQKMLFVLIIKLKENK